MQDTELFLSLAEIAGVFVGFGALIAVRSGGVGDVFEVGGLGLMVAFGIALMATALAPVVISRYGVTGHELWLVCSLGFLAVFWLGDEVLRRLLPERRAMLAAWPLRGRARVELAGAVIVVPLNAALVLIVLGLVPDQESALYLTAVVLELLLVAGMLLLLVSGQLRPASRGDGSPETEQPPAMG